MRRFALIVTIFACTGLASCGDSSSPPPTTPTPLPTLPVPPPRPPLPAFSVSGVVIEGWTELVIPGVTVSATGPANASTITAADGTYSLSLPPGFYTILLSKPLFRTRDYQAVAVLSDITHNGRIGLDVQFPVTSDLTGDWVGHGPHPDQPLWLTLIDRGSSFEGLYRDASSSSRVISGKRDGSALTLRIDLAGSFLTFEGRLDPEPRCLRGFIKREPLGGNVPITFARGAPAFCER